MAENNNEGAPGINPAEIVSSADAYAAVTRGEIDIQISTAKRFPRHVSQFKTKLIEMATIDPETAERCFYTLKRRDADGQEKIIQGPSVRLAEIAVANWGNLRAAARVIGIDDKFVTCQAACHDLETNVAVTMEVKRRITTKKGFRFGDDMIGVTANAGCAIAFRNSVFKVVPAAYIKDAFTKVLEFARGSENDSGFAARRTAIVDYFTMRGVELEAVLKYLGRKAVPEINADDVLKLRGVVNAIRDGEYTIDEAFGIDAPAAGSPIPEGRTRLGKQAPAAPATNPPATSPAQPAAPAAGSPAWIMTNEKVDAILKAAEKSGWKAPRGTKLEALIDQHVKDQFGNRLDSIPDAATHEEILGYFQHTRQDGSRF